MRQQDGEKAFEALLAGPTSTVSLQTMQPKGVPCVGEWVNPRTRGARDKPPTRPRISSGIFTRLAWDPQSLIMTGIT